MTRRRRHSIVPFVPEDVPLVRRFGRYGVPLVRRWRHRTILAVPAVLAAVSLSCTGSDDSGSQPKVVIPGVATMSLVRLPGIEPADAGPGETPARGQPQIGTGVRSHVVGDGKGAGERASARSAPGTASALRPVFDLGDNRLLAHWYRDGGLHLVAGSPGFARYVQTGRGGSGWKLGEREEGVPVAVLQGSGALTVPLEPDAAEREGAIALRVYSRHHGRLSLALNGRSVLEAQLQRGWQTLSVPIAKRRWRVGENGIRLALARSRSIAVSWLRIGGSAARAAAELDRERKPSADRDALLWFFNRADHSLFLSSRQYLVYYLYIPEGAVLSAQVVGETADAAACRVVVRARAHLAAVDGELTPDQPRADLDSLAGQIARIRLELGGCTSARLKGAALLAPSAPPQRRTGPPPRNVILWIMDTLRADRIRPIQPGARPEVPALERLAAEGAVFRQAYVQGNESQTSHASVWTSLFPAVHGVRTAGSGGTWRLSSQFVTIGELAHRAGMYASGVTANGMITSRGGYARGFDSFINMMREGHPERMNGWIPGRRILDRAIATLAGREKDPFFLFVGTIDTHKPWIGHEPWLSKYDPAPYDGSFVKSARASDLGIRRGSMRCTEVPGERDLVRINAIYDSAVSYQDRVLGQMLAKLDEWRVADQTMIVVTADHGEELWEDGRCGHGASLRDTLLHVPLFIRYPPLVPPGTVVEEGVDALDVLPTVADALGLEPPVTSQGTSLLGLAQGRGRGYPRPSYASQYEYAHAMRVGMWKIWLTPSGGLELFDLNSDPGERATVTNRPVEARFMIDLFRLFLANRDVWNKRKWGVVSNMKAAAASGLAHVAGTGVEPRARR